FLQARRYTRLPGGLEAQADLVNPHPHGQWKGIVQIVAVRPHGCLLRQGAPGGHRARQTCAPWGYSASVRATPHAGSSCSHSLRIKGSRRSTVASDQPTWSAISSFV